MVRMLETIGGRNYAGEDNYLIDLGSTQGVSSEVALWRAVITQALMDAGSQSDKREMRIDRAQAIVWLSGRSEDFLEVCARADLSPDYVREKARQAIRRGCVWRKESKAFLGGNPPRRSCAAVSVANDSTPSVQKQLIVV